MLNVDFPDFVFNEIKTCCRVTDSDTLYLIYLDHDGVKVKGKYLSGGRRPAPWIGYAIDNSALLDE
jgi:hypothetical protein